MLRNIQLTYNLPHSTDLSVKPNHEVEVILRFIDENITSFPDYYKVNNESNKENWISNLLVRHLNLCNNEQGGFLPYEFSKNPPQAHSGKETDIGVYAQTRQAKPITIIEFEAKRFSETSNNKEYVCGERGGIERFKRAQHGSHLPICGMFAYVQSRTSKEWIQKVNGWIDELALGQQNEIDWSGGDEKLDTLSYLDSNVQIQRSTNKRSGALRPITLYHYFLNLD